MQKRGATIYAEFLGGSFTCDAYHMTEPRPDGKCLVLVTYKIHFNFFHILFVYDNKCLDDDELLLFLNSHKY